MQKIKTEDLQVQLQQLDPRIIIVPNDNRPGASNVFLNGTDICPWVPSFEVQDEHSTDYAYSLPNDTRVPFKTIDEITEIVKMTLDRLKDPEYADALFDTELKIEEEVYGEHKA